MRCAPAQLLLVLLLVQSAPAAEALAAIDLITAQPPGMAELTLQIDGRIDNAQPIGHRPPVPWAVVKSMATAGSQVARSDVLTEIDPEPVQRWLDNQAQHLHEDELDLALKRLRTATQIDGLQERLADATAQRTTNLAAIAATREADAQERRIAELEVASATTQRDAAQARLERLRLLGADVPAQTVRSAEDALARANADLRVPTVRLELLRATTGAIARRRLEIATAKLDEDLAGDRGLSADITLAQVKQGSDEALQRGDAQRRHHDAERRAAAVAQPRVLAQAAGTVSYPDGRMRLGSKLAPGQAFVWVLEAQHLIVAVELPDEAQALLLGGIAGASASAAQGHGEVTIPALGGGAQVRVPVTVRDIAASPRPSADGTHRVFACRLAFAFTDPEAEARVRAQMKPGMRVQCALALSLPGAIAVIPTFCLSDRRQPRVQMADGSERTLTGTVLNDRFVVHTGVQPGERIRVAVPTAHARDVVRVTGVLEATTALPIRLSSGEWELSEVVPDGSMVQAGQVVARLSKRTWWRDLELDRFTVQAGDARAGANLAISRAEAEQQRVRALAAWHQAQRDADAATLEHFIARYAVDDEGIASAQSAVERAAIDAAANARSAQDAAEPRLAATLSANAIAARNVAAGASARALTAAQIRAVATTRASDWFVLADKAEAERSAHLAATAARQAYSLSCEQARLAQAAAADRYRADLRSRDGQRNEFLDETVLAPRAGLLCHRLSGGQPLKAGNEVRTMEPFLMPDGPQRSATLLIPARFYGHFSVGQTLALHVPALGETTLSASVRAVGAAFLPDPTVAFDRDLPGAADDVFTLGITLTPPAELAARLPPGTTVYADL